MGKLKKGIPAITEKMLIQSLKELEADELIILKALPVVPPHVEYSLTEKAKDLRSLFLIIRKWTLKYNL